MKRPLLAALEIGAGIILTSTAAIVADRFSRKANRTAQAAERIALAMERRQDVRIIILPSPEPDPCPAMMASTR